MKHVFQKVIRWVEAETATLTYYYPKARQGIPAFTMNEIADLLPQRSINAIYLKASRMELRRPELEEAKV